MAATEAVWTPARGLSWATAAALSLWCGAGAIAGEASRQPAGRAAIADGGAVEDPTAEARLTEAVGELNSSELRVRAAAMTRLLQDETFTLGVIEKALKSGGEKLSPEARSRLVTAARDRFSRSKRGAIGIQFWMHLRDRVVVERTFENFDAAGKLREGDMIVRADGAAITGPNARNRLQAIIVSHDPGSTINLEVRRGEKVEPVAVLLGKREDLENSMMTDDIIQRAWAVRAADYAPASVEPIKPPIGAAQWPTQAIGQQNPSASTMRRKGDMGPVVAGGGMPRGAKVNLDEFTIRGFAGNAGRMRGRAFNAMFAPGPGIMWDASLEPIMPAMSPQDELEELARERTMRVSELETYKPRPGATGDEPAVKERVRAIRSTLSIIEQQMAAIRAEQTGAGKSLPTDSDLDERINQQRKVRQAP